MMELVVLVLALILDALLRLRWLPATRDGTPTLSMERVFALYATGIEGRGDDRGGYPSGGSWADGASVQPLKKSLRMLFSNRFDRAKSLSAMAKFARSTLGALFAFTLLFAFAACDSGGSGSSGPSWVGDWRATSATFGEVDLDTNPIFWSISEDRIVQTAEEADSDSCEVFTFEAVGSDGNTITVRNEPPEDDEIAEFLLEASDGELTVTVVDTFGGDGFEPGGELRFESVDSDPREILGCEGSP
jgi:hypothetical protein